MCGKMQPALFGRETGDISHPGGIRTGCIELLIQYVFSHRKDMFGISCSFEFLRLLTAYAEIYS